MTGCRIVATGCAALALACAAVLPSGASAQAEAADLGHVLDDELLLVPTFFDDRVVAYHLGG